MRAAPAKRAALAPRIPASPPRTPDPRRTRARRIGALAVTLLPIVGIVSVILWIGHAISQESSVQSNDVSAAPNSAPIEVPGTELPRSEDVTRVGISHSVDAGWLSRTSESTGIPNRALAAYGGAALTLAEEQPDCRLGWTTLAGIGSVESGHGSYRGATLKADGTIDSAIRGPALDGVDFASIPDSDDGRWDGDTEWDRAIGPLQFIPATWETWGADGNGDGVRDPNQIDDAALAAGRYLCHSGAMSTADGWRAAIFSYNHDNDYVDLVAQTANTYSATL
jgi:membrane-bound lytic murein transglycosylase B